MQINKIGSLASDLSKKTGEIILNKRPHAEKLSKALNKINDFTQGVSYNPGRGAYYTIMGIVILPRLLEAREPDEFREILTRDVTSVFTILFAMKALKTGMCLKAQNKTGIALVKNTIDKNANKFKKLADCINPIGTTPLDSGEILSRYSRFDDKETFVKTLKTLDKEGGNIAKMFNVESQKGIITKIKKYIPFCKKSEGTPLLDAAKKMFGDDFSNKNNQELINIIENITPDNTKAFEGLEDIIGSNALNIAKEAPNKIKKGILNDAKNPITSYARNLSATFENISLVLTAGFLGFGLPKINEKLTTKKHMNKPMQNTTWDTTVLSAKDIPQNKIFNTIEKTNSSRVFERFI